jgi:hypothetical protein
MKQSWKTPIPVQRLLDLASARSVSLSQLSADRAQCQLSPAVRAQGQPAQAGGDGPPEAGPVLWRRRGGAGAPEDNSFESPDPPRWLGDVPRLMLGASAGPGTLAAEEAAIGTIRFQAALAAAAGAGPGASFGDRGGRRFDGADIARRRRDSCRSGAPCATACWWCGSTRCWSSARGAWPAGSGDPDQRQSGLPADRGCAWRSRGDRPGGLEGQG